MNWNSASVLLALSICGFAVSSSDRPVDCRKFVFAPLCRGVAAKRGATEYERSPPAIYVTTKGFQDFLKNVYPVIRMKARREEEDDDENAMPRRFYKRQKEEEGIYKYVEEPKEAHGESESSRDYENL